MITHKINNILILLLMHNCASSLLVDDFTDTNPSQHKLTSGSSPGITRTKIENSDPSHVNFVNNAFVLNENTNKDDFLDGNILGYKFDNTNKLNLSNYSRINLKVNNVNFTKTSNDIKPLATIRFYNEADSIDGGIYTIKKIDLSPMSSNSIFSVDLPTVYSSSPLNPFNPARVTDFDIHFNTGAGTSSYSIELDSIELEAIPEPFSMLTLAGGTLGFVKRKKDKEVIQLKLL